MQIADVIADVKDFGVRVEQVAALVQEAIDASVVTAAQLESIRATTAGLEADIRSLLRELDRRDELDWLVVETGEKVLALWTWRRSTRSSLLALWRIAHQLAVMSRELTGGTRQKVVVVREGETWQSIAARELGAWGEWPRLLAANPTLSPGALASGTSLVIPEKR